MDEIVTDVNEGWNEEDPTRSAGMHFKGSDDYLRTKVGYEFAITFWELTDRPFTSTV